MDRFAAIDTFLRVAEAQRFAEEVIREHRSRRAVPVAAVRFPNRPTRPTRRRLAASIDPALAAPRAAPDTASAGISS